MRYFLAIFLLFMACAEGHNGDAQDQTSDLDAEQSLANETGVASSSLRAQASESERGIEHKPNKLPVKDPIGGIARQMNTVKELGNDSEAGKQQGSASTPSDEGDKDISQAEKGGSMRSPLIGLGLSSLIGIGVLVRSKLGGLLNYFLGQDNGGAPGENEKEVENENENKEKEEDQNKVNTEKDDENEKEVEKEDKVKVKVKVNTENDDENENKEEKEDQNQVNTENGNDNQNQNQNDQHDDENEDKVEKLFTSIGNATLDIETFLKAEDLILAFESNVNIPSYNATYFATLKKKILACKDLSSEDIRNFRIEKIANVLAELKEKNPNAKSYNNSSSCYSRAVMRHGLVEVQLTKAIKAASKSS